MRLNEQEIGRLSDKEKSFYMNGREITKDEYDFLVKDGFEKFTIRHDHQGRPLEDRNQGGAI